MKLQENSTLQAVVTVSRTKHDNLRTKLFSDILKVLQTCLHAYIKILNHINVAIG